MPEEISVANELVVDIISDLHLDMYTRLSGDVAIKQFVNRHFQDEGDLLIIAGDITHKNSELPLLFELLNEKYQQIVVVAGNHDFYLLDDYCTEDEKYSNDRYANLLKACSDAGVKLLNCDYFDYKGFTLFGMIGWYDGTFSEKHFGYNSVRNNALWYATINDSRKIMFRDTEGRLRFDDMHHKEKIRLDNLGELRKADIFVSHCNPNIHKSFIDKCYRDEISTTFYCFNGEKILDAIEPQLVVHGHTHLPYQAEIDGRNYVCNPLGYPWETNGVNGVKRLIVSKKEEKLEWKQ